MECLVYYLYYFVRYLPFKEKCVRVYMSQLYILFLLSSLERLRAIFFVAKMLINHMNVPV